MLIYTLVYKSYVYKKICFTLLVEAAVQKCSVKKLFLKISQNSQENSSARVSFLIKKNYKKAWNFIKKETLLWHRCFPVNFAKFLRPLFFKERLCFSIDLL